MRMLRPTSGPARAASLRRLLGIPPSGAVPRPRTLAPRRRSRGPNPMPDLDDLLKAAAARRGRRTR
jgi:hypothetical protein